MTSIPPCGSHPFIVGLSVIRTEITNIFGPKDSMQDTTLLAGATMPPKDLKVHSEPPVTHMGYTGNTREK